MCVLFRYLFDLTLSAVSLYAKNNKIPIILINKFLISHSNFYKLQKINYLPIENDQSEIH